MRPRLTPTALRNAVTFTAADAKAPTDWIARAILLLVEAADDLEYAQQQLVRIHVAVKGRQPDPHHDIADCIIDAFTDEPEPAV